MMPSDTDCSLATSPTFSRRRVGLAICLAISAGTGLALILERTGQQSFSGSLEAHKTVVTTNCAAHLHRVSVKTGQTVVSGDPLFQLIDADLEDRLVNKRHEIAEFEAEVVRAKAVAEVELAWRRRELQTEIFEMRLKIATLSQEKLNKQVERIAWKEHLNGSDGKIYSLLTETSTSFRAVSLDVPAADDRRVQAMLREDAADASTEALATQIALCEQRLKSLESLDKELEGKIRASSGVDIAEARCSRAKQELTALEGDVQELTMVSPTYGMIGDVKLHSGDRVPEGSTLVEILDDQHRHVIAQIPSSSAAKVHQGSKVTLLFPMNERRTGVVASISPQMVPVAGAAESALPITIEPAGKLWPKLAIGSNVKVLLQ